MATQTPIFNRLPQGAVQGDEDFGLHRLLHAYVGGTPAEKGAAKEVYLALRTDGLHGIGTKEDPFDASTATKFDALMRNFGTFTWVYLAPGVYATAGCGNTRMVSGSSITTGVGFALLQGQRLIGSGRGVTELRLTVPYASTDPSFYTGVLLAETTEAGADDVEIRDLTVNANWGGYTAPSTWTVQGIQLNGTRCRIENVEVKGTYGGGQECWSCSIWNYSTTRASVGNVIRGCHVHSPANQEQMDGISLHGNTAGISGIVEGNLVEGFYLGFESANVTESIWLGNTTSACTNGWYGDSGFFTNLLVKGNQFGVTQSGVTINGSATGTLFNQMVVEGNSFQASDANARGIYFYNEGTNGPHSNFLVRDNTVVFATNGNLIQVVDGSKTFKNVLIDGNIAAGTSDCTENQGTLDPTFVLGNNFYRAAYQRGFNQPTIFAFTSQGAGWYRITNTLLTNYTNRHPFLLAFQGGDSSGNYATSCTVICTPSLYTSGADFAVLGVSSWAANPLLTQIRSVSDNSGHGYVDVYLNAPSGNTVTLELTNPGYVPINFAPAFNPSTTGYTIATLGIPSSGNTFLGALAGTFSGTFSGNGAALTALNASNVASGTLADGRLSANVPLLNGTNVFTQNNRFQVTFLTAASGTGWYRVTTDLDPGLIEWPNTFHIAVENNNNGSYRQAMVLHIAPYLYASTQGVAILSSIARTLQCCTQVRAGTDGTHSFLDLYLVFASAGDQVFIEIGQLGNTAFALSFNPTTPSASVTVNVPMNGNYLPGSVQQTSVTSAMVKADSTGTLAAATMGSDYAGFDGVAVANTAAAGARGQIGLDGSGNLCWYVPGTGWVNVTGNSF